MSRASVRVDSRGEVAQEHPAVIGRELLPRRLGFA